MGHETGSFQLKTLPSGHYRSNETASCVSTTVLSLIALQLYAYGRRGCATAALLLCCCNAAGTTLLRCCSVFSTFRLLLTSVVRVAFAKLAHFTRRTGNYPAIRTNGQNVYKVFQGTLGSKQADAESFLKCILR